jgi:transcriptional regulator with XRE-family HTH domain
MTGEEIKRRRLKAGYTRKELAEKLGYTANYIYMLETGRRTAKTPEWIKTVLPDAEGKAA